MTGLAAFRASLEADKPDPALSPAAAGLWWAGKGDWDRAHLLVQNEAGPDAAWVHAHLHRTEGDLGNAAYWYRRAGRPMASGPLDEEWQAMATALITGSGS